MRDWENTPRSDIAGDWEVWKIFGKGFSSKLVNWLKERVMEPKGTQDKKLKGRGIG
jgi:hypothetical protein